MAHAHANARWAFPRLPCQPRRTTLPAGLVRGRNAGQLRHCGSRLVVQRQIADELVDKAIARMKNATAGSLWNIGTTLAPIISRKQADRIADIVARTRAAGDTVPLTAGGPGEDGGSGGAYFQPTVIEARGKSPEEEFGSVLACRPSTMSRRAWPRPVARPTAWPAPRTL